MVARKLPIPRRIRRNSEPQGVFTSSLCRYYARPASVQPWLGTAAGVSLAGKEVIARASNKFSTGIGLAISHIVIFLPNFSAGSNPLLNFSRVAVR